MIGATNSWRGIALALCMLACGPGRGEALAAYAPPAASVPTCNTGVAGTCTDYFGVANYANSPLPSGSIVGITVTDGGSGYTAPPAVTISDPDPACAASATATVTGGAVSSIALSGVGTSCKAPQVSIAISATGSVASAQAAIGAPFIAGTGIRKFVDGLPGLCPVSGVNNLNQCLPIAAADTATFPGSDYYSIALSDYSQKMHTDLPATRLRGYLQLDNSGNPLTPAGSPAPH